MIIFYGRITFNLDYIYRVYFVELAGEPSITKSF